MLLRRFARSVHDRAADVARPLVAIVGAPNAGKSTLFNRLSNRTSGVAAFQPRALVSPMPGTTRDRLESVVEFNGVSFRVVDTGGVYGLDATLRGEDVPPVDALLPSDVEAVDAPPMERLVEAQVLSAVQGASVVLFMVDALDGVSPTDEKLAPIMRALQSREGPPHVLLLANKLDHDATGARVGYLGELYTLGLGDPVGVSAMHGTGFEMLVEHIIERLPPAAQQEQQQQQEEEVQLQREELDATGAIAEGLSDQTGAYEDDEAYYGEEDALYADDFGVGDEYRFEGEATGSDPGAGTQLTFASRGLFYGGPDARELKLAVVGRPNVGKSSLVNRLLGDARMVVHPDAGTTRDAVAAAVRWRGCNLLVADTAGIRRPSAGGDAREELDRMAVRRAKEMVMGSHAALLVVDASAGLVRGDLQIADLIIKHGKSCVILMNKVDLITDEQREALPRMLSDRLPMLGYAPLVPGSALSGEGIDDAMALVEEAARWRALRVPRRRLNDLFERAQVLRPLPMVRAKNPAQAGRIKIRYVLQAPTEGPTFVIHLNRQAELHPSVMRWVENTIRSQWAFTGTPIRIVTKVRDSRRRRREKERDGSRHQRPRGDRAGRRARYGREYQ